MPDGFDVDFSELIKLAASFDELPREAPKFVAKAIEVTARHVKDDWRDSLKGSPSIPSGPGTISYDVKSDRQSISAEVGPEVGKGGVGGLVGALELGIPGKAGPTGFGHGALQKNQGDFEKGLTEALKDAERAAGL